MSVLKLVSPFFIYLYVLFSTFINIFVFIFYICFFFSKSTCVSKKEYVGKDGVKIAKIPKEDVYIKYC